MDEAILNKIQKLHNLSRNNSNLNESAAAFAKMQELLSKHQLSMADIALEKKEEQTVGHKNLNQGGRRVTHWKSTLCGQIARLNQCRMIINLGFTVSFQLIGSSSDIEIVEYLYNSIAAQIDILADNALKNNQIEGKTGSNNFRYGAVETVLKRLKEAKEAAKQEYVAEHTTSTAIVLLEKQAEAVEKYVKQNHPDLRKIPTSHQHNESARNLGRRAGHKVSLNRGLNNSNSPKKLS